MKGINVLSETVAMKKKCGSGSSDVTTEPEDKLISTLVSFDHFSIFRQFSLSFHSNSLMDFEDRILLQQLQRHFDMVRESMKLKTKRLLGHCIHLPLDEFLNVFEEDQDEDEQEILLYANQNFPSFQKFTLIS
jgi:hypothetical protein